MLLSAEIKASIEKKSSKNFMLACNLFLANSVYHALVSESVIPLEPRVQIGEGEGEALIITHCHFKGDLQ